MAVSNNSSEPQPTRAVRLIFEYEGDRVRLVSEQPVEMAVTGFDLPQGLDPGYYVDARDGENLYARSRAGARRVHGKHGSLSRRSRANPSLASMSPSRRAHSRSS